MKMNKYDEYDLDGYLAQKFPKLPFPISQNQLASELDSLTTGDVFEIVQVQFDFENLYLRDTQLTDLEVMNTVVLNCLPFLSFQSSLLKENMGIMAENIKMGKDMKILCSEMKVLNEEINRQQVRTMNDLDYLISSFMSLFNTKFNKMLGLFVSFKEKKIRFFQSIDLDDAKIQNSTFDIDLFMNNSFDNLTEMSRRLQETLASIATIPRVYPHNIVHLNEVRTEIIQHFEDIRGIMKDIVLIFEYLCCQRRDYLKEIYSEFTVLYNFHRDINENIRGCFKLQILKERRIPMMEKNNDQIKTRLFKINLPVSLISSQKELDSLEQLLNSVDSYSQFIKKEIRSIEDQSDSLYCKFLKMQIIKDIRLSLDPILSSSKDLEEIIKLFREIGDCEKQYSAIIDDINEFINKSARYFQNKDPNQSEKKQFIEQANPLLAKLNHIIVRLKKFEKIAIFGSFMPIANQLRSKAQEKYEELYRFYINIISKNNRTPWVAYEGANADDIITTAEGIIKRNALQNNTTSYIIMVNSISSSIVEPQLDRILSIIRETQTYSIKLEKMLNEEPPKQESTKGRMSNGLLRLKYDVENARFVHLIFDDINFFNYEAIRNALFKATAYSDPKSLMDIIDNLKHHIEEITNQLQKINQRLSKESITLGEKRAEFEAKMCKLLETFYDSIQNSAIIEKFFQYKDNTLPLLDPKFNDEFTHLLKQTDTSSTLNKELTGFDVIDMNGQNLVQELLEFHAKNLKNYKNCDSNFYKELSSKLQKALEMQSDHKRLFSLILDLLNKRPDKIEAKNNNVSQVKNLIEEYIKFYQETDSLRLFFKNYSVYKNFKKVDNLSSFQKEIQEYFFWSELFKDALRCIKETEQLCDEIDAYPEEKQRPLQILQDKYYNKYNHISNLTNDVLNALDNFFYVCFYSIAQNFYRIYFGLNLQ